MYNLDVFEYELNHPFGLYGSIPLMLGHKVGLTTGVFWWVPQATVTCQLLRQGSQKQRTQAILP